MAGSLLDLTTNPALNAWERFAWSPEQQERIYRDWGGYLSHQGNIKGAEKCFDHCLEINSKNAKALYMRSACKRSAANTKSALEDALAAAAVDNFYPPISFAICHSLYELNEFENSKAELHDYTRKYTSTVVKNFLNQLIVVDQNLSDSLGDSLGYFMLKNRKHIEKVVERKRDAEMDAQRQAHPRWKYLRELNMCDVVSIPEIEEKISSPLELARRQRWRRIYNQTYFGRNWVDVEFIHHLIEQDHSKEVKFVSLKPSLSELVQPNYTSVKKFVKMLHCRSPYYNEITRYNKKLLARHKENYLNFTQYQTRRNMCAVLRMIRVYRAHGQIEKMSHYIESVMGDYVVLKTDRIMPWKFEFINEVYNTLALAHADEFSLTSENFPTKAVPKNNLREILRIPHEATDRLTTFQFGQRESYGADSEKEAKYQRFLARLEKRKIFAKYAIERCYLWYEMARTYWKLGRCDMCCSAAHKAIVEANLCRSVLWQFLSVMTMVKAYASAHKVEYCLKALEKASFIAKKLKNDRITGFVELAHVFAEDEINSKRKLQASDSMRRPRSESSSRIFSEHRMQSI